MRTTTLRTAILAAVAASSVAAAPAPNQWGSGGQWGGYRHGGEPDYGHHDHGKGKGNGGSSSGPSDLDILNYALTLEHLEATFYRIGLQNYTQADFAAAGFDATFYNNLKEVASDEKEHVDFLTSAIQAVGGQPVAECTYAFPVTDPKSLIAVASVLEGVGVSAYLGAAADIANKNYLTAAGSILTVESRHSAYIRSGLGESPFPAPFDTPLDLNEVYTLAAPFITGCPASNPPLPVKAFPALTLKTPGTIKQGTQITLASAKSLKDCEVYAAFITVTGPVFSDTQVAPDGMSVTTTVPNGIAGQSYVVLSNNKTTATDDTIIAGPAIVEVS